MSSLAFGCRTEDPWIERKGCFNISGPCTTWMKLFVERVVFAVHVFCLNSRGI